MKNALTLTLLICFLNANSGAAQSCYETIRNKGIELMNRSEYGTAISQFWVAMNTCADIPTKNDLQELITKAQNAQINSLRAVIQEKNTLYDAAVRARDEATQAQGKEKVARDEAERSALFALQQGRRAESLRLALLSDILRAKGIRSDAVTLAYIALKISPADSATVMQRAFGDAVRDSFQTVVYAGEAAVGAVSFLPASNSMLIHTNDQSLIFVNPNGNKTALIPAGGRNLGLAISHSGNLMLSWADNQATQLWDMQGTHIATLSGHSEPVRSACFSADDAHILTCSRDNTARVWNAAGKTEAVLSGHTGNVYDGGFLSGDKQFFTRSSDGTVRIWNFAGDLAASFNESGIYTYAAHPNASSSSLLTASADGYARQWDNTGKLQKEIKAKNGKLKDAAFLPNNKGISIRTQSKIVEIWSPAGILTNELRHSSEVEGLALEPESGNIATWTTDHAIQLWNAAGKLMVQFKSHQGPVRSVIFIPKHKLLLSCSKDGEAKLWDINGNILMDWKIDPNCSTPTMLAPDQEHVLTVNPDHTISLTPLPGLVLEQLRAGVDLRSVEMVEWMKGYEVQLFEQ